MRERAHLEMMSAPGFVDCRRVRYHEADSQGIVFNARYLEYIDVAMTEWFRWLGWDAAALLAAGCDPSLVTLTIDWTAPATVDEELEIAVALMKLGRSSFTLAFQITSPAEQRAIANATVVYVNFDAATHRSQTLPPVVRDRMNQHLVKETVANGIT